MGRARALRRRLTSPGRLGAKQFSFTQQSSVSFHRLLAPNVIMAGDDFLLATHDPITGLNRTPQKHGLVTMIRGPFGIRRRRGDLPRLLLAVFRARRSLK